MEPDELKYKVVGVCNLLAGGLPADEVQIIGESWNEIATYLADVARHIQTCGSSVAAYASIARRKANRAG